MPASAVPLSWICPLVPLKVTRWFATVPLLGPVTTPAPEPARGLLLVYAPTPVVNSVESGTTFAAVGMLTIGVWLMSMAAIL